MSPARHVPVRQCAVCRRRLPKRELLRLVRTPEGNVAVDRAGRTPGRGAYLCDQDECWTKILRKGVLEHALELAGPMAQEQREELVREARAIAEDTAPGPDPSAPTPERGDP